MTRHGDRRTVAWSNTVLRDWTGEVSGTASIGADVTDRRRAEEQLQHDAFHDALTGLPNRALFMDRLRHALARCRAPARGHRLSRSCSWTWTASSSSTTASATARATSCWSSVAGPRAARCGRATPWPASAATSSRSCSRTSATASDATAVAERIQCRAARALHPGGHEVFATASIGIAFAARATARAEDVLRDADTAMYRAKALGKARYEVFDAAMHARAVQRCCSSRTTCAAPSSAGSSASTTSPSCALRPAASPGSRHSSAGSTRSAGWSGRRRSSSPWPRRRASSSPSGRAVLERGVPPGRRLAIRGRRRLSSA